MPTKLYHLGEKCAPEPEILLYKSTISVEVLSNFNYLSDSIKLTKYFIKKITGEKPLIFIDGKTLFWCDFCKIDVTIKNAGFRCDECKLCKPLGEMNSLGLTLVLCNFCYKKNPKYNDFVGFLPKLDRASIKKDLESLERIQEQAVVQEFPEFPLIVPNNRMPRRPPIVFNQAAFNDEIAGIDAAQRERIRLQEIEEMRREEMLAEIRRREE